MEDIPTVTETPLMMGNWLCPYVHRVYLALQHKKVHVPEVEINLREKPSWLTKFSPHGKVPAITYLEGGEQQVLYESMVLMQWVEDYFAAKGQGQPLLPASAAAMAKARIIMNRFDSGVVSAFYKLIRSSSAEEFAEVYKGLQSELKWLCDNIHPTGPFMLGPQPSMVDAGCGPWLLRAFVLQHYRNVDVLAEHPRLQSWVSAYKALPEVQRTMRPEPGSSKDWESGMKDAYGMYAGARSDMSAAVGGGGR